MTKEWFTAGELAGMPEMPSSPRGVNKKGSRGEIERRKKTSGKGWEYHLHSLPQRTRDHILHASVNQVANATVAQPPAVIDTPVLGELTDQQRTTMNARLAILSIIEESGIYVGLSKAIDAFIAQANGGELPAETMKTLSVAKGGKKGKDLINRATLYRWFDRKKEGPAAVAPRNQPKRGHVAWLPQLLKLYQRPQKPAVAACLREWRQHYPDVPAPNLRTAQRALKALPAEMREYGRMGKHARRSIQPFIRRTFDGLWPMDVVTVDGHLFKGYVRHPMTGARFRPEVTTYIDIATRKAVGFSAWIAESQFAIWGALHQMVMDPECGVPAIHYSDNGAYRGDQHRSTMERIGTTLMYSEAYRAQARGVIERFNSSVWIPLAKQLPLYAGDDMDPQAFRKALKAADDNGAGLPGWEDFLGACRQALDEYNDRPHRSLGGKSPNQVWVEAVAEGWQPTALKNDDLHDLLPAVNRVCRRGEISLPWGRYASHDLAPYHQHTVRVAFDPVDGSRVWVSSETGVLLAIAKRDGNARPYIHDSQLSHAHAQREAGRVERLQRKLTAVREEGAFQIEAKPADPILQEDLDNQHAALVAQFEQERKAEVVEIGDDPMSAYRYWSRVRARAAEGETLSDSEREGLDVYWNSGERDSMERMFKEFGMDPLEGHAK